MFAEIVFFLIWLQKLPVAENNLAAVIDNAARSKAGRPLLFLVHVLLYTS